MSTLQQAKRELDILIKTTPDAIIKDFIPEILALCKKFGESGQSGGSAPYVASALSSAIKKLCLQEPITPIMGTDDEWVDISDNFESGAYQNNREGSIFKDKKTGKCYYLDAIIWKAQNGNTWTGTADRISSRQYIKSFPFTPKTFYIDVIEEEVSKGDWVFHIKNKEDLNEVWKIYDKYNK